MHRSLEESWESQKNTKDGLCVIIQENLYLSKEMARLLQEGLFVTKGSFESASKQVEYFYFQSSHLFGLSSC